MVLIDAKSSDPEMILMGVRHRNGIPDRRWQISRQFAATRYTPQMKVSHRRPIHSSSRDMCSGLTIVQAFWSYNLRQIFSRTCYLDSPLARYACLDILIDASVGKRSRLSFAAKVFLNIVHTYRHRSLSRRSCIVRTLGPAAVSEGSNGQ